MLSSNCGFETDKNCGGTTKTSSSATAQANHVKHASFTEEIKYLS